MNQERRRGHQSPTPAKAAREMWFEDGEWGSDTGRRGSIVGNYSDATPTRTTGSMVCHSAVIRARQVVSPPALWGSALAASERDQREARRALSHASSELPALHAADVLGMAAACVAGLSPRRDTAPR